MIAGLLWFIASLLAQASPAPISEQQAIVDGTLRTAEHAVIRPVVYLVPASGVVRATDPTDLLIDQAGLRFSPTVLPVTRGATVRFRNSDPLMHNVFSPRGPAASGFDLGTYAEGEVRSQAFDAVGTHIILCHVHPEMYAYVVVVPTPYYARADDDGRFRIENITPGRYTVRVWHRRDQSYEREITVEAGDRLTMSIDLANSR